MNILKRFFHCHTWAVSECREGTFTTTNLITGKQAEKPAFLVVEKCSCGEERAYWDYGTNKKEVSVLYAKGLLKTH